MTETFDLIQEKDIALVLSEFGERPLQCHAEGRMRYWRARLGARRLFGIVVRDFLLAQPAAPCVVAGVDQDPVGPGHETRLAAKAGDAALHFQEGFLYGVFGVTGIAKDIPRQVLHSSAMYRVETLVGAQIAGPAGRNQCGIFALGIRDGPVGTDYKVLGRFHSRPPFARQGRDSSLPRQRKSHSSHSWLLTYRRPGGAKRQACAPRDACIGKLFILY